MMRLLRCCAIILALAGLSAAKDFCRADVKFPELVNKNEFVHSVIFTSYASVLTGPADDTQVFLFEQDGRIGRVFSFQQNGHLTVEVFVFKKTSGGWIDDTKNFRECASLMAEFAKKWNYDGLIRIRGEK